MERVERVEDLDMSVLRAQGIVGADGFIPICIVWFRPAVSPPITSAGSTPAIASFSPSKY
jgi:hypothetical protein